MTAVGEADKAKFFEQVDQASRKAVWCAVASVEDGAPRVRLVHPTWEGDVLWFATAPGSPKARQLRANPAVDVQYQVSPPDFVHVLVRGRAELCSDDATRRRVWDVLDYDLSAFWPGGPTDPNYVAVRIVPERVELSKMFGSQDKRVWRR
jgi:general stress protein 26